MKSKSPPNPPPPPSSLSVVRSSTYKSTFTQN